MVNRDRQQKRAWLRRPVTWVLIGVVAVVLATGLWAFQPWRVFTHSRLNEALPAGLATSSSRASESLPPTGAAQSQPPSNAAPPPLATSAAPSVSVVAEGVFVSQEHKTTGTAKVVQLTDGSRVLRLEGFSTSDGPDVHVWLTDRDAGGDWHKYDKGTFVPLGKLKATDGNQNYSIPGDAQVAGLRSVVIWCERFAVAFGSAPLRL